MFGRDPEKKELAWKKKYYDILDQFDQKEKTWKHIDSVMRGAMSRMSVVMDGIHDDLDRELDLLRRAIRRGAEADKLSGIIHAMLQTVERVELENKGKKRYSPGDALLAVMEGFPWPRGSQRKVKALEKEIGKLGAEDDFSSVIKEMASLFQQCLEDLRDEKTPPPAAPAPAPAQALAAAKTEPLAVDIADASVTTRSVLQQFISQLHIPGIGTDQMDRIRQQISNAKLEQELERLASDLAQILNTSYPLVSEAPAPEVTETVAHISVNEVLIQLLERLELPQEIESEALELRTRLEGKIQDEEWSEILEQISHLIRRLRDIAQKEKRGLEDFLSQLTEQLADIDAFIRGMEQDHNDSIANGKTLDQKMQDQIRSIETSVQSASELEQLKELVRNRLVAISEHMSEFRRLEDARDMVSQERIQKLNDRIQQMEQESDELRNTMREEREAASYDRLTGVKNRLSYEERVQQEFARWKRYQNSLSIMVIDIDYFKRINDQFGHIAGDKVLHTIAQLLLKNIRETDFLARYGGEEFVILMPDTTVQEALGVADKLRLAVEGCGFHYRGESVPITISSGVTEFAGQDNPARAFDRADQAMYQAKTAGRNQCRSLV